MPGNWRPSQAERTGRLGLVTSRETGKEQELHEKMGKGFIPSPISGLPGWLEQCLQRELNGTRLVALVSIGAEASAADRSVCEDVNQLAAVECVEEVGAELKG